MFSSSYSLQYVFILFGSPNRLVTFSDVKLENSILFSFTGFTIERVSAHLFCPNTENEIKNRIINILSDFFIGVFSITGIGLGYDFVVESSAGVFRRNPAV